MTLDDKMVDPGADVYYSKEFRDVLEAHMAYLRGLTSTVSSLVDGHDADVYNGDLFGYLQYKGMAPMYHWVTMRLNNFYTPIEFGRATKSLLIPNTSEIDALRQSFKSTGTGVIDL